MNVNQPKRVYIQHLKYHRNIVRCVRALGFVNTFCIGLKDKLDEVTYYIMIGQCEEKK